MLEEDCYLDQINDRSNIFETKYFVFIFLLIMGMGFIVPSQCYFPLQFHVIKKLSTVFLFSLAQNVFLRFSDFYLKLMVLINNFVLQGVISVIHFQKVAFLAKETTTVEFETPLCEGVKV